MDAMQLKSARLTIIGLFVSAVALQAVVIPVAAAGFATRYPEVAHLQAPYVTGLVIAVVGFQLALVAAWKVATDLASEQSSAQKRSRWSAIAVLALCLMALAAACVFAHASFVALVGGPPVMLGLLLSVAIVPGALVARKKFLSSTSASRRLTPSPA